MKFTESMLKQYAAPLSDTENAKCKHAIEAIRDALKDLGYTDNDEAIRPLEDDTLAYSVLLRSKTTSERIHLFIQGSYANNTCVRNESDVDIAVIREDINEYAFGDTFRMSTEDSKQEAIQLKNAVETALRRKFPYQVRRGNKSIKVDGNTYRKKADTVPCLSMHYYYRSHQKDFSSHYDGIIIYADDGTVIRNFPKQHIANGKKKNTNTNSYYKKMVRIAKKMRYLMSDYGYTSADNISSFGIESLIWNIPNSSFTKYYSYGFAFEEVINYAYKHKSELANYYEANGIKMLCPTQQDVNRFAAFIDALHAFFNYDYGT